MARRFFEQGTITTPSSDYRIGIGKAGASTVNITIANFIAWLNGALTFLKPSNNLGDVSDKPTARTNLEVYSATEVDSALSDKSDVYSTTKTAGALAANNTDSFTPSSQYHPATKGYVDNVVGFLAKGNYVIGDVPAGSTAFTIPIGSTLADTSYAVFISMEDTALGASYSHTINNKTTSTFDLQVTELSAGVQNATVRFRIYAL